MSQLIDKKQQRRATRTLTEAKQGFSRESLRSDTYVPVKAASGTWPRQQRAANRVS